VDVAAELGVPALIAFAALLAAPWVLLARRRGRWTVELAVASAALAAMTVLGLLDYYLWTFSAGRIWAWLVLGLWVGALGRSDAGTPERLASTSTAVRRGADQGRQLDGAGELGRG
jgi:hypothetical protein